MFGPYVLLFAVCSFLGWVFESVWAIATTKKWDRRGFLFGPICPIYGVGVVAIILICQAIVGRLGYELEWWSIALIAFFGSMVLEYATSWILERWFHAFWWDYRNMPLNINGRTCVPAALLFSAGGLGAIYVIEPLWSQAIGMMPPLLVETLAYMIVVVTTVDMTLTINTLTKFQDQVVRTYEDFNVRMEQGSERMVALGDTAQDRLQAERKRLAEEGLAAAINGMGAPMREKLKHIKGFRYAELPKGRIGIRLSNKPINKTLASLASAAKERAEKISPRSK